MWHVSSCSGVATLRTAIHLLLTYLLTYLLILAPRKARVAFYTSAQINCLGLYIQSGPKKRGHRLMTIILSNLNRLANTLLKDEESVRDNHVLACNFAK